MHTLRLKSWGLVLQQYPCQDSFTGRWVECRSSGGQPSIQISILICTCVVYMYISAGMRDEDGTITRQSFIRWWGNNPFSGVHGKALQVYQALPWHYWWVASHSSSSLLFADCLSGDVGSRWHCHARWSNVVKQSMFHNMGNRCDWLDVLWLKPTELIRGRYTWW